MQELFPTPSWVFNPESREYYAFFLGIEQEKGFIELINDIYDHGLIDIYQKAINKCYSDFQSESATPVNDLIGDLVSAQEDKMVEKAKIGKYDHGYVLYSNDDYKEKYKETIDSLLSWINNQ